MSLRRSLAAWPIVAAAGLITVLAASLLAAGPMYASAVSLAGLQRVLVDAPVADANISVVGRADPARLDAVDEVVTAELQRTLGDLGEAIVRSGRSDSFDLPGPSGPLVDLVEIGFMDGLEGHASLVSGTWPDRTADAGEPIPVVVADSVAGSLGLAEGVESLLASRIRTGFSVPIRITGVFHIDDPGDPFWWADGQLLDGLVTSERFATYGPLLTSRELFAERVAGGGAQFTWRAFPELDELTLEGAERLRVRTSQIRDRVSGAEGMPSPTVTSGLPEIVARAQRSLLVSQTGVLVLTIQFVVLAAYAVLLSAALLVDHRRADTAMLRSRGAGPTQIAALALVEGLVITVPAALVAPWLAAVAIRVLSATGPLADIGLRVDPVVSTEAYVAAGVAATICLVALLLPALPRIRSFAAVHGSVGRAETRTAGHRFGLDVALLAVAVIGLWQLRQYGAPLTTSVQGVIGIDPLLVATPAIGFLAGAVLALRIVPMVAVILEGATARGRGLVTSLGARQLSRRPLRYTRSALLLMLAMAMGVFAIAYTRTWTDSQRDQAAFQVGADVRVEPGLGRTSLPRAALDRAYAALPGVIARMGIDREPVRLARGDRGGEIVGLDADSAEAVVRLRPDLADAPLGELMRPLAGARPTVDLLAVPGEPRRLRLTAELAIDELGTLEFDPDSGGPVLVPVDPASIADLPGVTGGVVVRDAAGQLARFVGETAAIGGGPHVVEIALLDATAPSGATLAYPLEVIGIELALRLPEGMVAPGATVAVGGLEALDGDAWAGLPLSLPGGWRATASIYGLPHGGVPLTSADDRLSIATGSDGLVDLRGVDEVGRGTTVTFAPAGLDRIADEPIPVVVTDPFLAAIAGRVGDVVSVPIGGVDREVRVIAAIRAFPTTSPDLPLAVMDAETLALLRFESSDAADPAQEWWLAVDEDARAAVVEALRGPAIGSLSVASLDERARALATDPVALGMIGALTIGVAAAALFAIVGFIVSAAVAARERITEFALLRALGLSPGQLSGWLSLENATLALISLIAGSGLGVAMAWVALPFVSVTQQAGTPFPPVDVTVPWSTILLLDIVGLVASAVTVGVLAMLLRRVGMAASLRTGEG